MKIQAYMMSVVGTFSIQGTCVRNVRLEVKGLRFSCLRCATFCCRLGGPVVTSKDLSRLRKAIPEIDDLTETVAVGESINKVLSSNPKGECALLSKESQNKFRCSKYELRPDVCRTYPFKLIRRDARLTVLVFPCKGLNYRKGELIDEEFVRKYLRFATVA